MIEMLMVTKDGVVSGTSVPPLLPPSKALLWQITVDYAVVRLMYDTPVVWDGVPRMMPAEYLVYRLHEARVFAESPEWCAQLQVEHLIRFTGDGGYERAESMAREVGVIEGIRRRLAGIRLEVEGVPESQR